MEALIFFGIQGSGKGTQAKILVEKEGYTLFETGAELRKLSQENSPLGKKVKTTIESGDLVSSELVIEIVKNFIQNLPQNQSTKIIFDGIPRSQTQFVHFQQLLAQYKIKYHAIHFVLSKEEAIKRLLKRAEIENRADDNLQSIEKRINIFYNETSKIINHYLELKLLIEIDASQSIEEIAQNLELKLINLN